MSCPFACDSGKKARQNLAVAQKNVTFAAGNVDRCAVACDGMSVKQFPKQGNVLWCNGSTTGFGSVCGGSNPPRTTLMAFPFFGEGFFRLCRTPIF